MNSLGLATQDIHRPSCQGFCLLVVWLVAFAKIIQGAGTYHSARLALVQSFGFNHNTQTHGQMNDRAYTRTKGQTVVKQAQRTSFLSLPAAMYLFRNVLEIGTITCVFFCFVTTGNIVYALLCFLFLINVTMYLDVH